MATFSEAIQRAAQAVRDDKDLMLAAVEFDGMALKDASDKLKSDRAVVLAAVAQNGCALQFAAEELQTDLDVVLTAVAQNESALQRAPKAGVPDTTLEDFYNYNGEDQQQCVHPDYVDFWN